MSASRLILLTEGKKAGTDQRASLIWHFLKPHDFQVPSCSVIMGSDILHFGFDVLDAQAEGAVLLDVSQAGSANPQAQDPVYVHLRTCLNKPPFVRLEESV